MDEDEFYAKIPWPDPIGLLIGFPWGWKDTTIITMMDQPFGRKYIFPIAHWEPES